MPDFTSLLSSPEEADRFVAATGNDLPDAAIHSAEDRKSPVGKIFLFSTKKEVPGIYKALAMQFHGKSRLLFGWTAQDDDGPGYAMMQKMNVGAPGCSSTAPICLRSLNTVYGVNVQKMLQYWRQGLCDISGQETSSYVVEIFPTCFDQDAAAACAGVAQVIRLT